MHCLPSTNARFAVNHISVLRILKIIFENVARRTRISVVLKSGLTRHTCKGSIIKTIFKKAKPKKVPTMAFNANSPGKTSSSGTSRRKCRQLKTVDVDDELPMELDVSAATVTKSTDTGTRSSST